MMSVARQLRSCMVVLFASALSLSAVAGWHASESSSINVNTWGAASGNGGWHASESEIISVNAFGLDHGVAVESADVYVDTRDASTNICIRPAGNYINDGTTERRQFFSGQTVHLPFVVDSDINLDAVVWANIAPSSDHSVSGIVAYLGDSISLTNGQNEIDLTWTINTNAALPGYYDVIASVRLAGNPSNVLDTTYPGTNNNDFSDAAWLSGDNANIHVCRGNPVILIHGISGDGTANYWGDFEELLEKNNHFAVVSFDYHGMTDTDNEQATIENIAAAFMGLQTNVVNTNGLEIAGSHIWTNSIRWTTNYFRGGKVDVVAHSMGGLVARAYMAGMAHDGRTEFGYGGEIDKLITLGSPLYGHNGVAFLGYWNWISDFADIQLHQMELGSRFIWNLNDRSTDYGRHLAIAGYVVGYAGDQVVPIASACADTLAATGLVLSGYDPGYDHGRLAKVEKSEAATHQAFLLTLAYLLGEELQWGQTYAQFGGNYSPVMIRTLGPAGEVVNTEVSYTSGILKYMLDCVDFGFGAHRRNNISSGNRTFKIVPTYPHSGDYAQTSVTLDLVAGRIHRETVTLASASDTESSSDGLSDSFEQTYFVDAHSAQTGDDDFDNDGLSNLWEQRMGYDPTDPNQAFAASSVKPASGASFEITLDTAVGLFYQLQSKDSLLSGSWNNVGEPVAGTGGDVTFTDNNPTGRASSFYRVQAYFP